MPRRYIQSTRFDNAGNPVPEVVAVVSSKTNVQQESKQQTYFKRNYGEALKKLIPKFYYADDETLSGTHIAFTNQVINSHILANSNQATILPVSALEYDYWLSAIDTPAGFSKYFFKFF